MPVQKITSLKLENPRYFLNAQNYHWNILRAASICISVTRARICSCIISSAPNKNFRLKKFPRWSSQKKFHAAVQKFQRWSFWVCSSFFTFLCCPKPCQKFPLLPYQIAEFSTLHTLLKRIRLFQSFIKSYSSNQGKCSYIYMRSKKERFLVLGNIYHILFLTLNFSLF